MRHVHRGRLRAAALCRIICFVSLLARCSPLQGGDWPQILGPQRNGQAQGELLRDRLDEAPRVVWEREVGEGYAGPAVAGGTVFISHRAAGEEWVEALDAQTAQILWKHAVPTFYAAAIDPDGGPRCVPLVHHGAVYVLGTSGVLRCIDEKTGELRWARSLKEDFGAPDGYFGMGSSPLIAGDVLLVNVGGRNRAGIVAFDVASGETRWQATDEGASYSSPVSAVVDGQPLAVFAARLHVVGLDPRDGRVCFQIPFGRPGATVVAATPLVLDNYLFLSAHYGVGATWVRMGKSSAETVWARDEVLSSQYVTSVYHGGYLYGIHGREDLGPTSLRCIDPRTAAVAWEVEGFGVAPPILADGKLVLLKTDGELVLALPDPKAYRELGRARLFTRTVRALPALSEGRLYARDTRVLKCIDLRR